MPEYYSRVLLILKIRKRVIYNAIKVAHRYAVQGSDTTMFNAAPSAGTIKKHIYALPEMMPTASNTQPAIKHKPPIGVTAPSHLKPCWPIASKNVSR